MSSFRVVLAGLFVVLLAPASVGAQCDEARVRAGITVTSIARRLRALPARTRPDRWRADPVTVGEPDIAPVLPHGCYGAVVEYTWEDRDRRDPVFRAWRHAVAVLALRRGRVVVVARRRLADFERPEAPQYHGAAYDTQTGTIVASTGGAGAQGGWGQEERYHLVGQRLVPYDDGRIQLGDLGRIGP